MNLASVLPIARWLRRHPTVTFWICAGASMAIDVGRLATEPMRVDAGDPSHQWSMFGCGLLASVIAAIFALCLLAIFEPRRVGLWLTIALIVRRLVRFIYCVGAAAIVCTLRSRRGRARAR